MSNKKMIKELTEKREALIERLEKLTRKLVKLGADIDDDFGGGKPEKKKRTLTPAQKKAAQKRMAGDGTPVKDKAKAILVIGVRNTDRGKQRLAGLFHPSDKKTVAKCLAQAKADGKMASAKIIDNSGKAAKIAKTLSPGRWWKSGGINMPITSEENYKKLAA